MEERVKNSVYRLTDEACKDLMKRPYIVTGPEKNPHEVGDVFYITSESMMKEAKFYRVRAIHVLEAKDAVGILHDGCSIIGIEPAPLKEEIEAK